MKANIFDIKHFAVHDGPGIRTTVFFKGCPLKCIWCHNPESISAKKQLGFIKSSCVNCGACVSACKQGAHYINGDGTHGFKRDKCINCGECQKVCKAKALTLYGKEVDIADIIKDVLEDKDFYDSSGGGVTLSGGECLAQPDVCEELLRALKQEGIHTAVDTCGFVSKDTLDKVIPFTDLFLYDMKAFCEDVHVKCTSRSNKTILENLQYIDDSGKSIEIRIPFVPEYNDREIEKIALFLSSLKNITGVRVLPYHNYAGTKYSSLDIEDTLPKRLPADEEITNAKAVLSSYGIKVLE